MIGSRPSSPGATNTSDFTIWPSSAPTAAAASCGGVGRLVEDGDLEGHALARGGLDDAADGRMVERVGHGAESSIGPGSILGRWSS